MNDREKAIEEMAKLLAGCHDSEDNPCMHDCAGCQAEALYDAGYRKQDDLQTLDDAISIAIFLKKQKAEIEQLKAENDTVKTELDRLGERLDAMKCCIYAYDGETMEYCVNAPCAHEKTIEEILAENEKLKAEQQITNKLFEQAMFEKTKLFNGFQDLKAEKEKLKAELCRMFTDKNTHIDWCYEDIDKLKAENERMRAECAKCQKVCKSCETAQWAEVKRLRAETAKEFAEKVKAELGEEIPPTVDLIPINKVVDEILKEYTK